MKIVILSALLLTASFTLSADSDTATTQNAPSHVTADQLKSMYDQNAAMIVLDARSKEYFDGNVLPKGKWLPYDASDEAIAQAAPSKDAVIIVYCASMTCPASAALAKRLATLGYTKVYEFPGGMSEWMQKGYPTEKN